MTEVKHFIENGANALEEEKGNRSLDKGSILILSFLSVCHLLEKN